MLKNKYTMIIASLIIAFSLIIFGLSNRFYIDTATKLKVDKLTGKTYKLIDNAWEEIGSCKNVIESTNEESDNYKNLDNSIVEYEIILPDEKDNSKLKFLGDLIEILVKNNSEEYTINCIELEVKLYKEDVLFYSTTINKESISINPISSVTVDFRMDSNVKYPDRPWKYFINTKEIKGSLMK